MLERRAEDLRELERHLRERWRQSFENRRNRLDTVEARLRLLSPANVLERGYSITADAATGRVIRDSGEVKAGQRLKTQLKRGEIRSRVEE